MWTIAAAVAGGIVLLMFNSWTRTVGMHMDEQTRLLREIRERLEK